ncbi:YncE family protein [Halorubrum sp. AD140]|uniref:YncE family protein n=1 Tax=Halorubrum sp. AD140 TaxID=3050073 RepID=UPI002ACC6E03|nr:YncE family protein [Halorubrum sp. AD140]MDZ5810023.1 YncE family protein [Halorubrum sp. AD140]
MTAENAAGDGATADTPPDRVVAVACEGDDVLALFALDTGEPLGEVPVGSHPVHAKTHGGSTFVATMGERAVTAVDPTGGVVRIETGVLGPSHFAAANGELFVSCTAGDALAVIDPEELALVTRIAVGAEPHEVAVSPDGRRLYAGSRRDGVVDVVDPALHERIGSVDVGGDARVQGVAVGPDGRRGYAVDQRNARVVAFETGGGGALPADPVLGAAAVGTDPYDLVVTGDRAFVPGRADGVVHEFDRDLELVAVHEGFTRPVDLFRVGGEWWVLDAEADRLRSLGGSVVETPAPGLVATRVGDRLVVSHYDDGLISLVDVDGGAIWTAETAAYPFGSVVV